MDNINQPNNILSTQVILSLRYTLAGWLWQLKDAKKSLVKIANLTETLGQQDNPTTV